jgi:SCY1-like protein 1
VCVGLQGSGEEVTVFILDSKNSSPSEIEAGKAAVKRLKTLRHPNILTFLDSVEVS